MAQKKTFNTPKGTAMYPWLNKADFQFDSNGQFKVNLKVSKEEGQQLVDQVKEAAAEAFGAKAAKAHLPFKTDDETGELIIVTKSKFRPKACDSTGAVIAENNVPPIYGGSTLKLAGNIYPYTAGGRNGVSLQLSAYQIVELAQASQSGVSFGAEEGGFVAANDNAPEFAEEPKAAAGGSSNYNF